MKKLNKLQKFIIASLSVFIGLAVVFGLSANIITTCAEDVQNSTENTEILDNSATDEEVIDGEETSENSGVLDKETDTETDNGAILDEIKDYLDNLKDENGKLNVKNVVVALLTDVKFWIIMAVKDLGIAGTLSLVFAFIDSKHKRNNTLTASQIESIATAAANKAVEKVVGKSIDVDISAEVSKAVKKELYALSNSVESLIDGVKNTEMLVASEAVALSHSRIINADEKKALLDNAKRAKAHAGKVVSAAKIEIEATEPSTKSSTKKAESVEEKNMHYINFGGVEKK
jgi:hypothetical protein